MFLQKKQKQKQNRWLSPQELILHWRSHKRWAMVTFPPETKLRFPDSHCTTPAPHISLSFLLVIYNKKQANKYINKLLISNI